ncbi:MAG: glycosyltransferase family 4 protein [Ruminococcaceae bacterium]|nr:glycosyltransferase family 4 protein [Oscillospiraceae bacterium]
MRNILYISRAGLPISAAGLRIFNIGTILENLGFDVHYLANRRITNKELDSTYEKLDSKDSTFLDNSEHHFRIDNKIYSYLPKQKNGKIASIKEMLELVSSQKAYKRVVSYCEKEKPYAVFLYNESYELTKKLIGYCKKNNIKLFADVTEWYEMDKNKNFAEKFVVHSTEKRITKLDHTLDGIIAISNYFEDYYKSKGANVVRIPPLMEIEKDLEIEKHEYYEDKSVLNFVYAGSPGGKDILIPFVKALQTVNKDGIKARLDVVGIDEKYFDRFEDVDKNLKETGVVAHGRLSHEETLNVVKRADFGILFRHNKRYAKAGFSTKLAECMSVGVPMMCNKIGGSDLCIEHMLNGVLTETTRVDELVNVIETLMKMSKKELLDIKNNAYKYGLESFDIGTHECDVKKLMCDYEV